MNRTELEDRLINFAVLTAEIINEMPINNFANNLANQLARSCTSPALNYGETQSAISKKDFHLQNEHCLERTQRITHLSNHY